jgi:two-component system OmpR family response regulator
VKVLLVEDEKRFADALKSGLESEGFAVDLASDGDQGWLLGSDRAYDVIILDIMLPGTNGFRLCKKLRDNGVWSPILMLTAKDGEYDEAEALDTGADDYLSKPFSYVVLLARLRALLRRGAAQRPAVLRCGDITLDPAARRCWRGSAEIDMTTRELAITEYLMRRAGEVVSKSELLDHLWDFAFEGDSNVVEVHISRVRQKLDKAFGRHNIQTLRGAGYRLAANDG